jgi:hypothetical protein
MISTLTLVIVKEGKVNRAIIINPPYLLGFQNLF